MERIQSCLSIYDIVILFKGLGSNISLISYFASLETSSFKLYLPFMIILCKSFIFEALKGTVPESIAKRTTPALQISA